MERDVNWAPPNRTAIIVFGRSAEAEAKSLVPSTTVAARLSEILFRRTLELVSRRPTGSDLVLATDGPIPKAWLSSLAPGSIVHQHHQRGEGFEARILDALEHAKSLGYERLVILGTDTPSMSGFDLAQACRSAEPVLGPSADGGFYLLGLNADQLPRLRGLPWRTPRLLTALRARFADLGLEHCPERSDIDHRGDVFRQRARLARLALRLLGRPLEDRPVLHGFDLRPSPRIWQIETGLAARGPPRPVQHG